MSEDAESLPLRAPAPPVGLTPAGPPPRLSVLVPVRDAAATVGEAIESALVQSPPPFEVVVSDDGSTDDLTSALRPFRDRVRVVHGRPAGPATARNRAAAVARGELLGLLDADDVWLPGRARALVGAATRRPDLAVLTTDAVVVRDGRPEPRTYYASRAFPVDEQDLAVLRSGFVFGAGAVRAAAFRDVGGYRDGARHGEDWGLFLRLLVRGHRAGLVDAPLYEYRRRSESLTSQRLDLAVGVLEMLADARPLLTTGPQRRELRNTEQVWRQQAARVAARLGHPAARRMALRAAAGRAATPAARVRYTALAVLPALAAR